MSEQFLVRPDVVAGLEPMGRERMSKRVAPVKLGEAGPSGGDRLGPLKGALVPEDGAEQSAALRVRPKTLTPAPLTEVSGYHRQARAERFESWVPARFAHQRPST
jgi:hypothetical protein